MSQTKVQLIAPIGVVTATTLETTGVLTATTFVGDIAGTVTGITSTTDNLNLGIITATSFAGDFTGIGSGLTGTPNVVAGVVTATKFVGNTPGTVSGIADGTNINAGIITATSFVGNLTGNAAGLSTTTGHANLGIVTATSFHGSGANLTGVSAGPVSQQAVTANGATTTIDLSSGNLIYMTQSANTTVAFANTEGNTDTVYLVRTKDDNTTSRSLTWPSGMVWDGGSEPTIIDVNATDDYQIFKLTTRDNGATWYGKEVFKNKTGGTLFSWGIGDHGALGQNSTAHRSSPTQVPGLGWALNSGVDNKSFSGEYHSGMIKTDGTLWVWGRNDQGQLGVNDLVSYSSPVQIPGTTWKSVHRAGYNNRLTAAIKTDGTLWTWGRNTYWHGGNPVGSGGQLGLNDKTSRSSPTQVPGTTWKTVYGGGLNMAATKTDGTLWAWGRNNDHGELGQNSVTDTVSPVQIGSGTDWNVAAGGGDVNQFYIKTDGTLWGVGSNVNGILGQNNTTPAQYSSPVQIPGTTWQKVNHGAGSVQVMGLKTDGTLWAWGSNFYGSLGQNTTNSPDNNWISSPTQIPGTNWSDISNYYHGNLATKTDGTLWMWGSGGYGKDAQVPTITYRSSPVQIPGGWSQALAGYYPFFGWKA